MLIINLNCCYPDKLQYWNNGIIQYESLKDHIYGVQKQQVVIITILCIQYRISCILGYDVRLQTNTGLTFTLRSLLKSNATVIYQLSVELILEVFTTRVGKTS